MKNLLNLFLLISALLLVGLACDAPQEDGKTDAPKDTSSTEAPKDGEKDDKTAESKEEIADITWKEIDGIYNLKSDSTDLQKEEAWKKYKGKRILWEGKVSDIKEGMMSGYNLSIKMNSKTLTSDLIIGLEDDQKEKVLPLKKGDTIKFKGTLSNWGSLLPITLSDGEIQ